MASAPGAAGPGAKFPQWTVILVGGKSTGRVGEVTNATEKALAEAVAFPNQVIFFTSQQAALNFSSAHGGGNNPGNTGALGQALGGGNTALNAGTQAAQNAATGKLFSFNLGASGISAWFTRGLKVLFGGILIMAGILKLTNTDKTLNQVLPVIGGPAGKVLKV